MNARLKALVAQRGYDPMKIESLITLHGGDEAWVEQLLLGRVKSHDDQHLVARFKTAPKPLDMKALIENAITNWDKR